MVGPVFLGYFSVVWFSWWASKVAWFFWLWSDFFGAFVRFYRGVATSPFSPFVAIEPETLRYSSTLSAPRIRCCYWCTEVGNCRTIRDCSATADSGKLERIGWRLCISDWRREWPVRWRRLVRIFNPVFLRSFSLVEGSVQFKEIVHGSGTGARGNAWNEWFVNWIRICSTSIIVRMGGKISALEKSRTNVRAILPINRPSESRKSSIASWESSRRSDERPSRRQACQK